MYRSYFQCASSLPARCAARKAPVFRLVGGRPFFELGRVEILRRDEFEIEFVEVADDFHLLHVGCRPAAVVVVKQRGRFGDVDVVKQRQMPKARLPFPVRGLMVIHQQEGLARVASFFQELEREVSDDVGDVAFMSDLAAVFDQHRVVVGPLADEDLPCVESGRIADQMPFADDRRLVPRRLKHLRERRLRAVKPRVVVAEKAVDVAVLSREDDGSARAADGVRAKTVAKQRPPGGDAIEIRRGVDPRPVTAHRLGCVIVRKDKNDVRPRPGL
jgi:hypothetical protein